MLTAVYPGSFDPLTKGHEDILRRAAALFPQLVVGVGRSGAKSPIFTQDERIAIAREVLKPLGNVRVEGFSGLLRDFARAHQARVVVRGLRSVTDFDFEFSMAGMNRQLMPEVETVFLCPGDQFQYVSSTLVREIALLGGDTSQFVSAAVAEHLRRKLAKV